MGLIDAVRAWLFGADDEADDADEPGDETGSSGSDGDDGGEPDGLDPAAATETRTASATDDAVDALRDVRQSQEKDDGNPETAPTEGDSGVPDDDRPKSSDDGGTNR